MSTLRRCSVLLALATISVVAPTGCASFPAIEPGGTVGGGSPRLNRLLRFIQDQRGVLLAERQEPIKCVVYGGVVAGLDGLTYFSNGQLPVRAPTDPICVYSLAASVSQHDWAVVTEVVVPEDGEPYTNFYRLGWDKKTGSWCLDLGERTGRRTLGRSEVRRSGTPATRPDQTRRKLIWGEHGWQEQGEE
jgi:hypothetical protein